MSLLLSMLWRELTVAPRRRLFYFTRMGLVGVFSVVLGFTALVGMLNQSTAMGLSMFRSVGWLTVLVTTLAAPVIAAEVITRERRQRTLGLLYMTDLRPWQIVVGKFLSATGATTALALALLPLLLICVSMGGVSSRQLLLALATVVSVVIGGTGVGLCAAAAARSERTVNWLLPVFWLLVYVGLPLCAWGLTSRWPMAPLWSSPIIAIQATLNDYGHRAVLINAAVNVLVGLPFLAVGALSLRRRTIVASAGSLRRGWGRDRGARRRRAVSRNPVFWRDYRVRYGGGWRGWALGGVALLLVAGFSAWCVIQRVEVFTDIDGAPELTALADAGMWLVILCGAVGAVSCFGRYCRTFAGEERGRAMSVMLTSDLTGWDIVRGKELAILMAGLPWLAGVVLGLAAIAFVGVLLPDKVIHLLYISGWLLAMLGGMVFAAGGFGMIFSLLLRHSILLTVGAAIGLWLMNVFFGGMLMLFITIPTMLWMTVAEDLGGFYQVVAVICSALLQGLAWCLLPVGAAVLTRFLLVRNFRAWALKAVDRD